MTSPDTSTGANRGHDDERTALIAGCGALTRRGLLSHSGHGNFSVRLDGTTMLLTPKGLSGGIQSDELAVVGLDGTIETGRLEASTQEIVPMHTAAYRARADVRAVVHTHSPHLTAFALANEPLPCRYEALLRRGQPGEVPVVPWAPRGSEASADGITEALARCPGTLAVLLANHGVLVFGASASEAAAALVAFEEAAAAEVRATALGGAKDFPEGALDQVRASIARVTSSRPDRRHHQTRD